MPTHVEVMTFLVPLVVGMLLDHFFQVVARVRKLIGR